MGNWRYFRLAIGATIFGLVAGTWLGWQATGTIGGSLYFLLICAALAVLEISLSFDNAIVNANKLKTMDPIWQKRFLTWGILIAVFGMRILFPLIIVAVAARIDPIAAIELAISYPEEYARIMNKAHLGIAAFGGTFLMMVGLSYFFDGNKDIDWIRGIEQQFRRAAAIKGIEVGFVLVMILVFSSLLGGARGDQFMRAGLYGLLAFLAVEVLGHFLDSTQRNQRAVAKGGAGAFIYLEMLDASFSFDGVISAFALSQNLFIIAIGLGIGAFYVRSMTIMLVERGTLAQYRYLEHGAFYAILMLAMLMYTETLVHIPEAITGLVGALLIGIALLSSIRYNKFLAARAKEDQPSP